MTDYVRLYVLVKPLRYEPCRAQAASGWIPGTASLWGSSHSDRRVIAGVVNAACEPVVLLGAAADTPPLVGMRMLDRHNLNIDIDDGGRVLIQAKE